ncbi:MAG: leucyl-tRNA synthetase [Patescibacteria group bacterium]|nr:leucyl-tRNA synthetase [Patescibacteria group bacterium]
MEDKYNPKFIEPKWQKFWEENPDLYAAKDDSKAEKRFILDMFPYPSGAGLHVGHVESYTATDIYSRYFRMRGKNVLHPQGFDAFGLPAENYAIKTGIHPQKTTEKSIKTFKKQLGSLGLSYDWSREVNSSDLDYYKWTQWFFLLLYKNGLAYKKKAKVNWCDSCKTVLANEQVEDGLCERCKNPVRQKDLEQWFLKITDFIEDKVTRGPSSSKITPGLLSGLEKIDWPESTKMLQKNWIGRSEGTIVKFLISNSPNSPNKIPNSKFPISNEISNSKIQSPKQYLEVFTTRLDTIYGCTYCVVAPEHGLIKKYEESIKNKAEVEKYLESVKGKSDLDRTSAKDKTGVELKGIKVINPFTNEELPVWVADYVLSQYGTGAVMAVPAHDTRDYDFSIKYSLPVKEVVISLEKAKNQKSKISAKGGSASGRKNQNDNLKLKTKESFTDDGILANSGEYSGLTSEEAREKMAEWLEENNLGNKKINYKLRDWLVSRQRYWGAPIPIIYCEKCGTVPVPEEDLPVKLPTDVDFLPTGESPLKYSKSFQNVKCPVCGAKATRESDTMDTFVCSSWYYFRYADPKNEKKFASKELIKKWLPVDLYVGGAEHSVLHLLYARFFTKVLHNLGYIDFDEPFLKLRHQGIILSEDGRKMSKSLGNVVNPDDEVKRWGADSLRIFEMFMGPLEDMKPWNTKGIVGVYRFLEKIWKLQNKIHLTSNSLNKIQNPKYQIPNKSQISNDQNGKLDILLNKTIKKVTEDIEAMRFNTAISSLMILANALEKEEGVYLIHYTLYLILLSPFAPHISEELWNKLGHKDLIFKEKWPEYDSALIKDEEVELVVQVNGKVRDRIKVAADISEEEAKAMAISSGKVENYTKDREIRKVIYVRGRLVNIVI